MTTLNLQVATGGDDGHIDNVALSPNLTDNILNVGNVNGNTTSVAAVRFTSVTVPNAATITSATLTVTGYSTYSTGSTISVIAACQNADNAAALAATTGNFNTTNRPRTTANSGGVNLASVTAGATYTFNLTSSVQEVVNRAGWASGNAIVVLLDNNGSSASEWQELEAYNHSPSAAAKLDIVYSTGGGAQTVTPNAIASTASVPNPTVVRGAVLVAPNAISSGAQVFSPTIVAGNAIVPNAIASTAVVYNPTVAPGGVAIVPNAITSGASVPNPTVQASVTVTPNAIASTGTVYSPAIGTGTSNYNVSVGSGYTDVSPLQIVRTRGNRLYTVAPTCDSYPGTGTTATIRVHKANTTGVPGGFTRMDSSNEPTAVNGNAVALDSDDNIRIVWAARSATANTAYLRYAVFNTGTDTWGAVTTIASDLAYTDIGQGDQSVAVAVDAFDVVHVVYLGTAGTGTLTNRRVYYRNNSGGSWSSATQIDSGVTYTGNQKAWAPAIAFDGAGRILVTWMRGDFNDSNTGTIYSRVYSGGSWGSTVQVSAGGDSVLCSIDQSTRALVTPDGTYHLTYVLYSATNSQKYIRYRYSTDNGATWAGNNPTNQATHNPTVGWTGTKVRILAHGTPDNTNNHGENLYYFEGDGGAAAWGTWTQFVTGANYDSSINVRWSQYNHHFPHTFDVAYWNDNYPNVLYAGTEIFALDVAPGTIASAATVYQPTVVQGALTVQPDPVASTSTVHAPTALPGAVSVLPGTVGSTSTVHAPTALPGAVTVVPGAIASGAVVHNPAISQGALIVQPDPVASTSTVHAPAIVPGATSVQPDPVTSGAVVYAPTVAASFVVRPGDVASGAVVYSVTVQASVVVQPGAVDSTAIVHEPVVGNGYVVTPGAIVSGAVVHAPTIQPGAVTVLASAVSSVAVVHDPTAQPGAVTVLASAIAGASAVYDPTVQTGGAVVQPDTIASTAVVFEPFFGGGAVVAPTTIPSGAVVYSVTVQAGVSVAPDAIAGTSTVHAPGVLPGAVSVVPGAITSGASVHAPTVLYVGIPAQVVQPDPVEGTSTVLSVALVVVVASRSYRIAGADRSYTVAEQNRTITVEE